MSITALVLPQTDLSFQRNVYILTIFFFMRELKEIKGVYLPFKLDGRILL